LLATAWRAHILTHVMPSDSSIFPPPGSGPRLEEGQLIDGRYRLEEFLGRGGMGTVWRGVDETLELPVALKFLHEILIRDDSAIDELKRETKRALQLTHPNIVRVHSLVEDPDNCIACIAMEFVPGVNLTQQRLRATGKVFEPEQLAKWAAQLCGALAYAHEKAHIIHRDLKPANLLLDVDDDLKVTDFGIAASANESITRLTGHTAGGTLEYMSPQQAQGERPTPADDLYSFGATLYELLTGEPPFGFRPEFASVLRLTPQSVAARRFQKTQSAAPIPPEWEKTIAALLAKHPSDRPSDARSVAKMLGLDLMRKGPEESDDPEAGMPTQPARIPADIAAAADALTVWDEDATVVPKDLPKRKEPPSSSTKPLRNASPPPASASGSSVDPQPASTPVDAKPPPAAGGAPSQSRMVIILAILLTLAIATLVWLAYGGGK
jgi:serine/threonine protein kinase